MSDKPVTPPTKTPVKESAPAVKESAPAAPPAVQEEVGQINLMELPIENQNDALNVMLGFLGLAQKRGTFAINESAKIFDCVKMFQNA